MRCVKYDGRREWSMASLVASSKLEVIGRVGMKVTYRGRQAVAVDSVHDPVCMWSCCICCVVDKVAWQAETHETHGNITSTNNKYNGNHCSRLTYPTLSSRNVLKYKDDLVNFATL